MELAQSLRGLRRWLNEAMQRLREVRQRRKETAWGAKELPARLPGCPVARLPGCPVAAASNTEWCESVHGLRI